MNVKWWADERGPKGTPLNLNPQLRKAQPALSQPHARNFIIKLCKNRLKISIIDFKQEKKIRCSRYNNTHFQSALVFIVKFHWLDHLLGLTFSFQEFVFPNWSLIIKFFYFIYNIWIPSHVRRPRIAWKICYENIFYENSVEHYRLNIKIL